MPIATFPLQDLSVLTQMSPDELPHRAGAYGLEAIVQNQALEVDVAADRPDLLAPEGLARVLKVHQGAERSPQTELEASGRSIQTVPQEPLLRPRIAAIVVEMPGGVGVEALEAFLQFQEKVTQTYGRQRQKLAMGAYDLGRVSGDLVYGLRPIEAIELVPLGGDRVWTGAELLADHPKAHLYGGCLRGQSRIPVLEDGAGQILAVPPLVNAEGVGRVTATTEQILVDVTGTSAQGVAELASLVAHNWLDRGATVKTVTIVTAEGSQTTPSLDRRSIPVSSKFLNEVVGTFIPKLDLQRYLGRMDLELETGAEGDRVWVPSYRTDILSQNDVAGDLLVAVGIENLEADRSDFQFSTGHANPLKTLALQVGDWSQRMGLLEVKSYILTDPKLLEVFPGVPVQAANARSQRHSATRTTLQAGLLEILSHQINAPKPLNCYEVGEVLTWDADQEQVQELLHWAFASLDPKASFSTAKSYVQTLLQAIGLTYGWVDYGAEFYIAGRSAAVQVEGRTIGHFGEIHPALLHRFSFPEPVCAGELDLSALGQREP
ncbi:MAG: phenylalanine--tRNA ligase subunit beta [Prochlorothrix sp.]